MSITVKKVNTEAYRYPNETNCFEEYEDRFNNQLTYSLGRRTEGEGGVSPSPANIDRRIFANEINKLKERLDENDKVIQILLEENNRLTKLTSWLDLEED